MFIQMPRALSIPMNMPRYNWRYHTEPEPHLDGRRLHTPRGKVLGGSSSINGLVYVRGNALDFDGWEARARQAGVIATCCRISAGPRRARRAATITAATAGRCRRATAACTIHCTRPGWRPARRPAIRTRRHQRLSAGRLRPHGHDRACGAALRAPRTPICGRRCAGAISPCAPHALATAIEFDGAARPARCITAAARRRTGGGHRPRSDWSAPARSIHRNCSSCRASGPAAELRDTASRCSRICRGSAKTCRTTWSSISRSPARGP